LGNWSLYLPQKIDLEIKISHAKYKETGPKWFSSEDGDKQKMAFTQDSFLVFVRPLKKRSQYQPRSFKAANTGQNGI
jgi:hypothetical protein